MDFISLTQYAGLGGFLFWALIERGFHLSQQKQEAGEKQDRGSYGLISLFWYGSMLFAFLDAWSWELTTFSSSLPLLHVLGVLLIISGLLIRFLARRELGKEYSVHVKTSEKHQLITSGIYRAVRHPAYLGLLLLFLGIPLSQGSWGGILISLAGGFPALVYRITLEEQSLRQWFESEYEDYQKTSWRLIPGIW